MTAVAPANPGSPRGSSCGHTLARAWQRLQTPWVRRTGAALFLLLVVGLMVYAGRHVPWADVGHALRDTDPLRVALAALLAAASYAVYASFDLLGRRVTGHGLSTSSVLTVAATSYGINQNLGYLVGGLGLRMRLYLSRGLDASTAAAVAGTSVLTNWLGHLALLGTLLVVTDAPLPTDWPINPDAWPWIGAGALLLVAVYLLVCTRSGRREWQLRSLSLRLPAGLQAVQQLALSMLNWTLMAAALWVLLPPGTPFGATATALLLAAVAGALAHVPAGMGVLEAVFVTLLGRHVPVQELIAAILVYRAVYQWLPGLVAAAVVLRLERQSKLTS
jgi:glycosyltransferase 2 family protein